MEQMILLLTQTAKMVGVSPQLLIAICMVETDLRHINTPNDGATTSYGVCQVKLETAHFMGRVYNKPYLLNFTSKDISDLENNIKVAALYIKYQINRYNGDLCKAVAAYNAGSFKESTAYPRRPVNWRYVKKVQDRIDQKFKSSLECKYR